MNRRPLILLVAAAVTIGLLGLVYSLLRRPPASTTTNELPLVTSNVNTAPTASETERERDAAAIRSVAVKVSEGWASGPASQSNRRPLSVLEFLTENLRVFATAQAGRSQSAVTPDQLAAARALTEKVSDQTESRATVEVTLQISTTAVPTPPDAGSPEVTYRKLKLGVQKVGEDWRVSEVTDLGTVEL